MLHLMICDDEKTQLSLLETFLKEWAAKRKYETEIRFCQNAGQFLFFQEEKGKTDILLLDIDMPGMNGISLAHKLREKGEAVQIIFVTGLSDYVLEGYDVEAVSYLIKPVEKEKLFSCLDKAAERCRREEPALLLETAGGVARVKVRDVCYLESDAHDTQVHCIGVPDGRGGKKGALAAGQVQVIRSKMGIHQLEESFKQVSGAFFKTHRSYLVNLSYVSRIGRKDVVMDTGEALPVARGRWEALNQAYLNYYRNRQG